MNSEEIIVNGVRIAAGDGEGCRTLALPSGAEAKIRHAHGRDLMRAQRAATGGDPTAVVFALIAELCEIDGRRIVFEDVMEMDLGDVLALQNEVVGENFELPPQRDSQD
ncbi:MAG TPA: hypothetical protein VMA09_23925 [Candidatus Binataceae bacterium]|nr:hypothetical protein [Candidatus Binataceae bacterium]